MTFVAGNCIHLQPGFHATAGTAGTTFHAWMETAPTAVSFFPSGGTGLTQPFTFTGSSPAGYTNLSEMYALFNTAVSGMTACYIRYNRASNLLYLADNSGSNWLGGFVPGSASWAALCRGAQARRPTRSATSPPANLDDVVAHIDHAAKIGGIDAVGLGSDFDGIDQAPVGLDDVSKFPNLTRALLERGYSADAIARIYGGNLLRLMRAVEATGAAR